MASSTRPDKMNKEAGSSTPVEGFRPTAQGWRFRNAFPGLPVPVQNPGLPRVEGLTYGLCGGMCFAALDYLHAGRRLPSMGETPARGSALYGYLVRRQLDSFGRWGRMIPKYVWWMLLSDEALRRRTLAEWPIVAARLNDGQRVVLGLMYNSIRETVAVWLNHQVLAYGYEMVEEGRTAIWIYDPNRPGDDSGAILVEHSGDGLHAVQVSARYGARRVRGFFPMLTYEPRIPPETADGR